MFGSAILDVAIGLVLVFLLVSLVLTAVQEAVEAAMRSRAADLNRAIFELLQQDKSLLDKMYNHPLVFALHRGAPDSQEVLAALEGPRSPWIFGKAWRTVRAARKRLPSYIPREVFSAALRDLCAKGQIGDNRLTEAYKALNELTGGDLARTRAEIEAWYDAAMDRASGWYKRRVQRILFFLGLLSALALNINAITIGNALAVDDQARAFATDFAESLSARQAQASAAAGEGEAAPISSAEISTLYGGLRDTVGLPIGWSAASTAKLTESFRHLTWWWAADADHGAGWLDPTLRGVLALLALCAGYLITAFAGMLGAPFWFDVLNRVMVIRSTVKPREKSPDEPSEDGGTRTGGRRTP